MICIALNSRGEGDQNRTWKEENFSCNENTNKPFSLYNLPFSDPQTGNHKTKQKPWLYFPKLPLLSSSNYSEAQKL